jgi:hypothetical protein
MPNPIKYTTGSESLALKKGNFYIGTGDVGKGPSDVTGYYQGVSPSGGGYVIYMNKPGAPGDLSYHNATNDSELISFTNNLAGTSYTTVQECLVYYASQTDKVVLNHDFPPIVTNGLVLNIDAGFTPSYPTSGTTWYNLNGTNNGTLTNGPTFNNNGYITFDGVDDYVLGGSNLGISGDTSLSISYFARWDGASFSTNFPSGVGNNTVSNTNRGLSTTWSNGRIALDFWVNRFRATSALIVQTWYYVVFTKSPGLIGSTSKLYVNGKEVAGAVEGTNTTPNILDSPFVVGRLDSTRWFNGRISSSQIYNRTLSESEILQNYFGGSIVTNGLVFALDAGNLVSYESGSTTTYSLTGTSTGTLVNGVGYNGGNSGTWVFDGVDDYTSFTAPGLGGTATVEMWCKIGSGYSNKMFCGWLNYDVYCAGGRIGYNTGNSDVYGISQATVDSLGIVGQWAHYVFEFRSDVSYTNNKIYINGVLQTLSQQLSTENPATRNFNNGNGRIAIWGGGGSYNMPMSCAIFRVYNRSLSQQEVLQNYATQKPRF